MYSVDIVNLFDTVYKNLENKDILKDFFKELRRRKKGDKEHGKD